MSKKLVLHVDDDLIIQTVMASYLYRGGYVLVQYERFADALKDPDIAVVDAVVSDFETGEQMLGSGFLATLRNKGARVPMALFSRSDPERLRKICDATVILRDHPPEVIEKPNYNAVVRWLERVFTNT